MFVMGAGINTDFAPDLAWPLGKDYPNDVGEHEWKGRTVDNDFQYLDFSGLTDQGRYRYLVNMVFPRPIAFVTSMDTNGVLNAAPFSFFNVLGGNAPQMVISSEARGDGVHKDTTRNLEETKEFVVNMVSVSLLDPMNICATDFPPHVNELEVAGLDTIPSTHVKPPRIRQSPAQFECRLHSVSKFSARHFLFGEVLAAHVAKDAYDPETDRIRGEVLDLVGRTYDRDGYADCRGVIKKARFSPDDFPDVK